MIWLAMFLTLVLVGVLVTWRVIKKDANFLAFRIVVAALVVVIGFLTLLSSITTVKSGHVGVPVLFGKVKSHNYPEGLNLVNPFVNVKEVSIQLENYWMSHTPHDGQKQGDDSISVRASNGLQMPVDICVPYRLNPEHVSWVYQNLGTGYADKVLRPAISTAARRIASHYTAEELYSTKRDEFALKIHSQLEEEINKTLLDTNNETPKNIFFFSQVMIGHIGVPDSIKNSIESKLKADQDQQAMEFQIMREKKEKERKKIEAEGIQGFQDIVSKGIDEKLLRWKAIEATLDLAKSHNAKIVIIGSGKDGLPIILGGDVTK